MPSLLSCLKTAHSLKWAGWYHLPRISDPGSKGVVRAVGSSPLTGQKKNTGHSGYKTTEDPLLPQYESCTELQSVLVHKSASKLYMSSTETTTYPFLSTAEHLAGKGPVSS